MRPYMLLAPLLLVVGCHKAEPPTNTKAIPVFPNGSPKSSSTIGFVSKDGKYVARVDEPTRTIVTVYRREKVGDPTTDVQIGSTTLKSPATRFEVQRAFVKTDRLETAVVIWCQDGRSYILVVKQGRKSRLGEPGDPTLGKPLPPLREAAEKTELHDSYQKRFVESLERTVEIESKMRW